MTSSIIIALCALLLLAYAFDFSSSRTRIPTVILLLALGWGVRQFTTWFDIVIPDLSPVLPVLGTIGLILIVLEGSLELELNRSKVSLVNKSTIMALLPMLFFIGLLTWAWYYFYGVDIKICMANAVPLAIISSAIAIPSAKNLNTEQREFITYESSLSDIFGVILFNFITLNDVIGASSIEEFLIQFFFMLLISFVATLVLAYLLGRIRHNVKYVPIILIVVLIYQIAKVYHLPSLIFILFFGIFLGNLKKMQHNRFIQKLRPEELGKEVHKFGELAAEIVFLIRSLFFLLFGYLLETEELLNPETLIWAVSITAGILLLRMIFLKVLQFPLHPLLFIAPRGLITILLFLSIPVTQTMSIANKSLIIQVIVLTAFTMMIGLMTNKKVTDDV